jgi:acetyltransferase
MLNLGNAQEVRSAYQEMLDNIAHNRPDAHIDGISIEPMVVKPN